MSIHRRAAKRDANEGPIVKALRAVGCTVAQQSGKGVPDLLVGHQRHTVLIEVKMPGESLTPAQEEFHARWRGAPIHVVTSVEEALAVLETKP